MISVVTTSVHQTKAVAAAIAELVDAGDLVLLTGDLGAGKTAFVQGFAAQLGVNTPVTSPTFTLAHRYQGRLTVHHLDVYRLSQLSEVVDLAIPELLDGNTVTLIEWGDAILPALPAEYLEIAFTFGPGGISRGETGHVGADTAADERRLTFRSVGSQWAARQRRLAEVLSPWAVAPC